MYVIYHLQIELYIVYGVDHLYTGSKKTGFIDNYLELLVSNICLFSSVLTEILC